MSRTFYSIQTSRCRVTNLWNHHSSDCIKDVRNTHLITFPLQQAHSRHRKPPLAIPPKNHDCPQTQTPPQAPAAAPPDPRPRPRAPHPPNPLNNNLPPTTHLPPNNDLLPPHPSNPPLHNHHQHVNHAPRPRLPPRRRPKSHHRSRLLLGRRTPLPQTLCLQGPHRRPRRLHRRRPLQPDLPRRLRR